MWLNWASGALPFPSGLTYGFQKLILLLKGSLDRYTPLCIKQITNENLLYNAETSTQCSVVT